ncbi:MAG: pentapeptide repeat-containing protein [Acidobacteriota bacterium]
MPETGAASLREQDNTDTLFLVAALALAVGVPLSLFAIYYFAESVQYLAVAFLCVLTAVAVLGFVITANRDRLIGFLSEQPKAVFDQFGASLTEAISSFRSGEVAETEEKISELVQHVAGRYAWLQTRRWILAGTTGLLLGFSALVGSALLKQQNDLIAKQNEFFQQQIEQQQVQLDAQQRVANQSVRSDAINRIYGPTYRENPRVKAEAVRSLVAVERVFVAEGQNSLPTTFINLHNANLERAWLDSADLERVSFRGASLSSANFNSANVSGAQFRFATLAFATFLNASASGAFFAFSIANDTEFADADLAGAQFANCILKGADLSGANLDGTIFIQTDLRGSDLDGVKNWRGIADISGANIHGVENMPEGFRDWALSNGAIDDPDGLDRLSEVIGEQMVLENHSMFYE